MALPSVIVNDLYFCGSIYGPNEADSPLLIDSDAVLTLSIILQCFETVAGRYL
jgi:hypothetical protein